MSLCLLPRKGKKANDNPDHKACRGEAARDGITEKYKEDAEPRGNRPRGVCRKLSHRRTWRPGTRANGQGPRDLCSTGVLVLICLGSRQSRAIGSLQPGDPASLCANSLKANPYPNQTTKETSAQALAAPVESVFTSKWAARSIREASNSPSGKAWMAMSIPVLPQKAESSRSHDVSWFSWLSNFVVLKAFLL